VRLAVVSDLHITEEPCRSDVSLEYQAVILSAIASEIAKYKHDAVLIGGDVYDGRSTAAERTVVWEWVSRLALSCPVLVIRGNHDEPLDISALNYLDGVTAYVEPPKEPHEIAGLRIGCVPWPTRKVENGAALLADYVRGLVAQRPDFILGHLDLVGATLDGGQESTGKVSSVLTLEDFGGIPTALGHYHHRKPPYTGGIRQMHFGDDAAKGFGIYDTDKDEWQWFGPYGRKLWTVEFKQPWDSGMICGLPNVMEASPDDLIRVRYTASEDEAKQRRETAEKIVAEWPCEVIIDPKVIADTRTRGAEVAAAVTPWAKLEAYWGESKPARADEIKQKMEALDETP